MIEEPCKYHSVSIIETNLLLSSFKISSKPASILASSSSSAYFLGL